MANHHSVTSSAALQGLPPALDREWPIELVGDSALMRRVRQQIGEAAAHSGPVLLLAEPGFDAERVARHLHAASGSTTPFVAVNCEEEEPAALERLLFGAGSHVQLSRHGTLFLARIIDMRASAQARLARALRDGDVQLDDGGVVPLKVRIVASADPDMSDEVADGRLRPDLYRRLARNPICLPPLRDRAADIAAIAVELAEECCRSRNMPRPVFTHAALASLAALPLPHNTAELEVRVGRLCAAAGSSPIRAEDVLADVRTSGGSRAAVQAGTLRDARRHFEREYIGAVLSSHGWRIPEAAAALGIERANLYRKIRQIGLARPSIGARGDR